MASPSKEPSGTTPSPAVSGSDRASVGAAPAGHTVRNAEHAQEEAPSHAGDSGVALSPRRFEPAAFDASAAPNIDVKKVTMLNDVNLRVRIELGRTHMLVEDVLKLGEGSVVELDKPAGDPVDVYVNDRLMARGEVLVLNDSLCVRVSEVLSHDPHRVCA